MKIDWIAVLIFSLVIAWIIALGVWAATGSTIAAVVTLVITVFFMAG